jgi:Family of unknown function (DUF6228)
MHSPTPDEPYVRLTARPGSDVQLTLSTPQRPWNDMIVDYLVDLSGAGLQAQTMVTSLDGDGLPDFLDDLGERFRGWSGARDWRSLEDQLRIEATWLSRGHVTLRVRVRPKAYDTPWDLSVDFDVEAGAQMESLADEVASFFSGAV